MLTDEDRQAQIKKGVPVIVELGPRDIAANAVTYTRRDAIAEKHQGVGTDAFAAELPAMLGAIDAVLWDQAIAYREANTIAGIKTYDDLAAHFRAESGTGFVHGKLDTEADLGDRLQKIGVTVRCLPYAQSGTSGSCLVTGRPATHDAVFAKAY